MSSSGPFRRHLQQFAARDSSQITLLSSLRAALALGLDFPVACILAIGLRVAYGSFPFVKPVDIRSVPSASLRTQLEDVKVEKSHYTRSDLVKLYNQSPTSQNSGPIKRAIDASHVISFWAMTASTKTHLVDADSLKRFQTGAWADDVMERRRRRSDILPLWRGGPISAAGHSWFVRRLFGVRVYEP